MSSHKQIFKVYVMFGKENTIYCIFLPENLQNYKHKPGQGLSPSGLFPKQEPRPCLWCLLPQLLFGNEAPYRIAMNLLL